MQNPLDSRQQALIPVAAFAAQGNIDALTPALNSALDAGLTVNELKETLVQLYAYCGFPRSLNALSCLMTVTTGRQARGMVDEEGVMATPSPENWDSLQAGSCNQTQLVGRAVSGPLFDFAPIIDRYLKAHLFGDIFQRDVLDWATRELATVSMLAALSGAESQLKSHYAISLRNGLTAQQLRAFVEVLADKVHTGVADNAAAVLESLLNDTAAPHSLLRETNMTNEFDGNGIFPRGDKNEAYAQYFTGDSFLTMLSMEGVKIGHVAFAPGCRNYWHIHHKGGQILLVTGGRGWYQAWGETARELKTGDVVHIPAETKHWHGAAHDSWFAHIAVEVPAEGASNEWLEEVGDTEYNSLP